MKLRVIRLQLLLVSLPFAVARAPVVIDVCSSNSIKLI